MTGKDMIDAQHREAGWKGVTSTKAGSAERILVYTGDAAID